MSQPEFISDYKRVEKEKFTKVKSVTNEQFVHEEEEYFQQVLLPLQLTYFAKNYFVSFSTVEHHKDGMLTFHEESLALEGLQRLAFVRSVFNKKSEEFSVTFHRNELRNKAIRTITGVLELDRIIGGF